jgi:hypothetical protein
MTGSPWASHATAEPRWPRGEGDPHPGPIGGGDVDGEGVPRGCGVEGPEAEDVDQRGLYKELCTVS